MANKKTTTTRKRPVQLAKDHETLPGPLNDITPIAEFLEMFRELTDPRARHPHTLISLKVPQPLLAAFRFKAKQQGIPYQTMIKRLMVEWLKSQTL